MPSNWGELNDFSVGETSQARIQTNKMIRPRIQNQQQTRIRIQKKPQFWLQFIECI